MLPVLCIHPNSLDGKCQLDLMARALLPATLSSTASPTPPILPARATSFARRRVRTRPLPRRPSASAARRASWSTLLLPRETKTPMATTRRTRSGSRSMRRKWWWLMPVRANMPRAEQVPDTVGRQPGKRPRRHQGRRHRGSVGNAPAPAVTPHAASFVFFVVVRFSIPLLPRCPLIWWQRISCMQSCARAVLPTA